jgi:peptidoglycan/xylan/chitin deacetylase (PgdA/CDA1 family)
VTTTGLPVLCYHRVGGPFELGVTRVGARAFGRQVRALAAAGWRTARLQEYTELAKTGATAPNTLLFTFDDAYASLEREALPTLRDAGFSATLFVITDFVGRENTWDLPYGGRQRHLGWPALERWWTAGFDVGSHTATHPRLDWLTDEAVLEELARSREMLVERLGPAAGLSVAYPFGRSTARVRALARRAGYTVGFGIAPPGPPDPMSLARLPMYSWEIGPMPFGMGNGPLAGVAQALALGASRCAVGTAWMQRLTGRRYGGRERFVAGQMKKRATTGRSAG